MFERADGALVLIEVKSSGGYMTHAALDNALDAKGCRIDDALILAKTNVKVDGSITYLPLYMAGVV